MPSKFEKGFTEGWNRTFPTAFQSAGRAYTMAQQRKWESEERERQREWEQSQEQLKVARKIEDEEQRKKFLHGRVDNYNIPDSIKQPAHFAIDAGEYDKATDLIGKGYENPKQTEWEFNREVTRRIADGSADDFDKLWYDNKIKSHNTTADDIATATMNLRRGNTTIKDLKLSDPNTYQTISKVWFDEFKNAYPVLDQDSDVNIDKLYKDYWMNRDYYKQSFGYEDWDQYLSDYYKLRGKAKPETVEVGLPAETPLIPDYDVWLQNKYNPQVLQGQPQPIVGGEASVQPTMRPQTQGDKADEWNDFLRQYWQKNRKLTPREKERAIIRFPNYTPQLDTM